MSDPLLPPPPPPPALTEEEKTKRIKELLEKIKRLEEAINHTDPPPFGEDPTLEENEWRVELEQAKKELAELRGSTSTTSTPALTEEKKKTEETDDEMIAKEITKKDVKNFENDMKDFKPDDADFVKNEGESINQIKIIGSQPLGKFPRRPTGREYGFAATVGMTEENIDDRKKKYFSEARQKLIDNNENMERLKNIWGKMDFRKKTELMGKLIQSGGPEAFTFEIMIGRTIKSLKALYYYWSKIAVESKRYNNIHKRLFAPETKKKHKQTNKQIILNSKLQEMGSFKRMSQKIKYLAPALKINETKNVYEITRVIHAIYTHLKKFEKMEESYKTEKLQKSEPIEKKIVEEEYIWKYFIEHEKMGSYTSLDENGISTLIYPKISSTSISWKLTMRNIETIITMSQPPSRPDPDPTDYNTFIELLKLYEKNISIIYGGHHLLKSKQSILENGVPRNEPLLTVYDRNKDDIVFQLSIVKHRIEQLKNFLEATVESKLWQKKSKKKSKKKTEYPALKRTLEDVIEEIQTEINNLYKEITDIGDIDLEANLKVLGDKYKPKIRKKYEELKADENFKKVRKAISSPPSKTIKADEKNDSQKMEKRKELVNFLRDDDLFGEDGKIENFIGEDKTFSEQPSSSSLKTKRENLKYVMPKDYIIEKIRLLRNPPSVPLAGRPRRKLWEYFKEHRKKTVTDEMLQEMYAKIKSKYDEVRHIITEQSFKAKHSKDVNWKTVEEAVNKMPEMIRNSVDIYDKSNKKTKEEERKKPITSDTDLKNNTIRPMILTYISISGKQWKEHDENIFRFVIDGLLMLKMSEKIDTFDIFDVIATINILYNYEHGSELRGDPSPTPSPTPSQLMYKRVRFYCDRLYPEIFDILDMSEMLEKKRKPAAAASAAAPAAESAANTSLDLFENDKDWKTYHSQVFGMTEDYIPLICEDWKLKKKTVFNKVTYSFASKKPEKRIFKPGLRWFEEILYRGAHAYYWLYTCLLIAMKEKFIDECLEAPKREKSNEECPDYYGSNIMTNMLRVLRCGIDKNGMVNTYGENYTPLAVFIKRTMEIYDNNIDGKFASITSEADSIIESKYTLDEKGARKYLSIPTFDDEMIQKRNELKKKLVNLLEEAQKKQNKKDNNESNFYKLIFNAALSGIPIPIGRINKNKVKIGFNSREMITFCKYNETELIEKWYLDYSKNKKTDYDKIRKSPSRCTRKKAKTMSKSQRKTAKKMKDKRIKNEEKIKKHESELAEHSPPHQLDPTTDEIE